VLKA
jgi:hypothetical protein